MILRTVRSRLVILSQAKHASRERSGGVVAATQSKDAALVEDRSASFDCARQTTPCSAQDASAQDASTAKVEAA
jgi:hypothetical protein